MNYIIIFHILIALSISTFFLRLFLLLLPSWFIVYPWIHVYTWALFIRKYIYARKRKPIISSYPFKYVQKIHHRETHWTIPRSWMYYYYYYYVEKFFHIRLLMGWFISYSRCFTLCIICTTINITSHIYIFGSKNWLIEMLLNFLIIFARENMHIQTHRSKVDELIHPYIHLLIGFYVADQGGRREREKWVLCTVQHVCVCVHDSCIGEKGSA